MTTTQSICKKPLTPSAQQLIGATQASAAGAEPHTRSRSASFKGNARALLFTALGSMLAAAHGTALAAAPIVTSTAGTTPFAVSSMDLLQTSLAGVPVVNGLFTGYGTGGEPVLRDGNAGGTQATDYPATAIVVSDATVTYNLDLGASPQGYNITAIETFGAWDEGRDQQRISIAYATVAAPDAFVTLTAYSFDPIGDFSRVSVTPGSGDAFLMQNVYAIRFSFPDQENSAGGYRELDVFGVSAVPEPASYAMLLAGLGLIGWSARRRTASFA